MRTIKLLLLVFLALLAKGGFSLPFAASALWAADFEFRGAIEPTDDTSRLLAYYVNRFAPEELSLSVVGQPLWRKNSRMGTSARFKNRGRIG